MPSSIIDQLDCDDVQQQITGGLDLNVNAGICFIKLAYEVERT